MPGQVHVVAPHFTHRHAPAHAANWCLLASRMMHQAVVRDIALHLRELHKWLPHIASPSPRFFSATKPVPQSEP